MPSELKGLKRQLTWAMFTGTPTADDLQRMQRIAAGASGKIVGMAQISSGFDVNFGGTPPDEPRITPDPGRPTFGLEDTVTVTVWFNAQRSWKRLDGLSSKGEDLLLDHEQGHYDLSALMARDCFIDLMLLKPKDYANSATGQAEVRAVVSDYKKKLEAVQKTYDNDTTHGAWVVPSGIFPERKESFQVKWEGFIEKAFTIVRTSGGSSPDGIPYKKKLLDVLDDGGFKIV
jgi:hypothetical protein